MIEFAIVVILSVQREHDTSYLLEKMKVVREHRQMKMMAGSFLRLMDCVLIL